MKDLFGKAILDYQTNNNPQNLVTETTISEADEMSVAYLFRNYSEMPKLEKAAMNLAFGNVLDAGCGAGSHSLYLKKERNLNVLPIDISPAAVEACRLRGLENAQVADLMEFDGKFDTILLLMNGTGLCGKLQNLPEFLNKLKSLLNAGGQVLIDSSDIIYMFDEDDHGGKIIPEERYYGEIEFTVRYKGEQDTPFDWLYLDFNCLNAAAKLTGMDCEKLIDGEHFDYLAKLSF